MASKAPEKEKIIKSVPKTSNEKRLIVILEKASLESVKNGKTFELLNCDKHKSVAKKFKRDISTCRPDITHQCLLMLLDSPLNRAGLLQVYIHTEKNVLIEVNPQTRIPRTFDRFSGLMVQLLHKLSIHAADGPQKLLKVIKNPVTDHLPIGCKKIGMSFKAEKCVDPRTLVPSDDPVVFVVGAMAHGSIDTDYTEEEYSISNYPLSAALTCAKLCNAFEEKWDIM
ncbi:ribosomal RNA small subunit methyltransferase NEP1-like [Ruditapes philippinarum]|uniref:ribosomal RNA small subunit methyltransferase NEP1-like n=1 Tax=Ruditapes philippinarum TaxID=129788 RepID=UPI00295BF2EE|nr:ribosomal RNA small subunit methyltransferase NEP1-like [Ruditapes philippinarum]